MDERQGNNPDCKHEWVYDDWVVLSNPPIYHRICKLCGRLEHEYGRRMESSKFGEINEEFHGPVGLG